MTKRILICDDSPTARLMVADALRGDGWEIAGEVGNGEEAIRMYEDLKPDAVTMDLNMSQSDGIFGLKGILKLDSQAKVVVVSSITEPDTVSDALRMGALDYVVKPFDPERLCSIMARCLEECPSL